ncbi:MAG: ParA family protein [Magnetococcales bacterium]|nr:ParA family protein [Magnetococcales bacterium]MBF0438562.1 ParA family protein [Magnetococcales bacterium]
MTKIIALVNRKGGVGKTTTAVNLAAAATAAGKKILLVDFDPQGNATTAFGINKENNLPTIYDVITGQCHIKEATRSILGTDLSIIPSTADLSGAEVELVNTRNREFRLRDSLKYYENKYDWILVDCPPSLGLLTVNSLAAAHAALIPLQCEFYAMEGLNQVLKTIEIIKKQINKTLTVDGILLTLYEYDNPNTLHIAQEVRNHLDTLTFQTTIPRDSHLSMAPSFGRPGVWYHPWSPGAQAYQSLTLEILRKEIKS